MAIATLNAIGSTLEKNSAAAIRQMSCVLGVQACVVLYALYYGPSADRVINILIFTQFSLEAIGTPPALLACAHLVAISGTVNSPATWAVCARQARA